METKQASSVIQYYVAVATPAAKLPTLVELQAAIQGALPPGRLSLVVCCSSRDSLDRATLCLTQQEDLAVGCLHADLARDEADNIVTAFRDLDLASEAVRGVLPEDDVFSAGRDDSGDGVQGVEGPSAKALVLTDTALKAIPKPSLPLDALVVINFDLPGTREVLSARKSAAFGSARQRANRRAPCIMVSLATAGALDAFRALEAMSPGPIHEMPVHVPDILAGLE